MYPRRKRLVKRNRNVTGNMRHDDRSMTRTLFHAHIELLYFFLAHRDAIVERIQGVLNAQ